MAKRRNGSKEHRRRSRSMTVPLGVVIGLAPGVTTVANYIKAFGWRPLYATQGAGDYRGWLDVLCNIYLGISPNKAYGSYFTPWGLPSGLYPLLAGVGIHKLAGMFGVNRLLGRAHVPFIRI